VVKPSCIVGACAYGSKVAGYARSDSDYDLMVVARNFREGVRYKYLSEPIPASALIVDEGLLHQDASASYLGEFVVGRLLNVYEPIANSGLFHGVEHDYKMRVVVEALLELSSDYGIFCRHILVPYDYFLFDKLRKRSVLYPPALYSYVKTYSCPLAEENRAITIQGFREAASSLSSRGYFTTEATGVRIVPERMKGDAFTKVQSIFSLTTRGVAQYAVHGYAGRVGLSVFRNEAQSKLKRMREKPEPLPELEQPKTLLRLDEGVVIPDASRLEKNLARLLGYVEYATKEKLIGDPYSTTRILTFRGGGRESSLVLKNFSDIRSLKWALLGVWAAAANKFSMAPLARLEREYATTRLLRATGVLVPTIVAVSPDARILVKEYVEGPPLSSIIDGIFKGGTEGLQSVAAYGKLMAKVHGAGIALGDAKASNVIVSPRGLFLTDLEQADPEGDRAWDLAEFIYYTAKLLIKEDAMKQVARAFLDSYASEGPKDIMSRAGSIKYLRPFQPFILPTMAKSLRDMIGEFA
jgi:tRNA A-37 threonylcarbamoyl transferase component Bud32